MNINETTGLRDDAFAFGTFEHEDRVFPALVHPDGQVVDISDRFTDTHEILDDWDTGLAALKEIASSSEATLKFGDLRPLPPLRRPNMLHAGANFRRHVIDMMAKGGFGRREGETDEQRHQRAIAAMKVRETTDPYVFVGMASAMCGATDDIVLPALGYKHDWELELAAVISRHERHVSPEDADQLIAGYTILNDLGTHDYAMRTDAGPMTTDFLGKFEPTFKPVGPFIVPAEFVDLEELTIVLTVNGEGRQDEGLDDMVFPMNRLVSYASSRVNLQPGDVISSGSPWGNAPMYGGAWLKDGDVVESKLTFLGSQRNRCVDEKLDPPPTHKLTEL